LEQLEAQLDRIRERDRVAASLHGKQRMMEVFSRLFDDEAREDVDTRLKDVFAELRDEARTVAVELAKHAYVEMGIDDLARINAGLSALEKWLDAEPSERIACCQDLLTFITDLRAVEGRGPLPSEL
jgi:hypothetical protein